MHPLMLLILAYSYLLLLDAAQRATGVVEEGAMHYGFGGMIYAFKSVLYLLLVAVAEAMDRS